MSHLISLPVIDGLHGEVTIPGDKSISHRSVILGAIAEGITTASNFLDGEDCLATIKAFQAMGVNIEGPCEQTIKIYGVGKYGLQPPNTVIDCGNSGTSIRLLSGLLAAQPFKSELTGDSSLLKRPMARVSRPLTQMGANIQTNDGKPPLFIEGNPALQGIHYSMPEASAQVKSCLLLAGLYASGETCIKEPGITRDHTERMLKTFSYPVSTTTDGVCVDAKSQLKAASIQIPGDISSAAFLIVAATIIPKSDILIRNVGLNPTRIGILHILKQMGADITILNQQHYGDEPVGNLRVRSASLNGITIPGDLVPLAIDEFPILFIAAACAKGQTRLHGAKELRTKESDRISSMVDGLNYLGIQAQAFEDGVLIEGGTLQGGQVNSYDDHRIAMSFAIAGAVAKQPVFIKNCANVKTSFPKFVSSANQLNLAIQEVDNEI